MLSTLATIFPSTNNLILQTTLALCLTLLLSVLKIPLIILYGLHTYVHPDDVAPPQNNSSSGGLKAAIRRPGTTYDSSADIGKQPRKKSKEKIEFDEKKAQIYRIKLNDSHLLTRVYFKEFGAAFNSTIVALACLLLHKILPVCENCGIMRNGSFVCILLGFVCVFRLLILIYKVSCERSASKRSEKQMSVLLGVLGFVFGLMIIFGVFPRWVFDFGFELLDGYGKLTVVIFMACILGFLYMPAMRNTRAFWIGTDQIRCNLAIVSCGWLARTILYANYVLTLFTSLLWISPFTELLVNKNVNGRKGTNVVSRSEYTTELAGHVGMSIADFNRFRLFCLLVTGVFQLVALRPNVQMFLNEAVFCWYQRLHASKVPDLDYSRAKVFLHNHYLSLVVLQFFVPSALVLLFLGLSQSKEDLLANFQFICTVLPCSAFTEEVALFMAWWIFFVWATLTTAGLALYRHGILYVS